MDEALELLKQIDGGEFFWNGEPNGWCVSWHEWLNEMGGYEYRSVFDHDPAEVIRKAFERWQRRDKR